MKNMQSIIQLIEQRQDIITLIEDSGKTIKFLTKAPYPNSLPFYFFPQPPNSVSGFHPKGFA